MNDFSSSVFSKQNLARVTFLFVTLSLVGGVLFFALNKNTPGESKLQKSASLPEAAWFVSPEGSDNNTGKTRDQALATIQKAVNKAVAGEAIRLLDGRYEQSIKTARSGKQKQPIILMGSPKAVVVGSSSRVVEINHDYIRLTGFSLNGHHGPGQTIDDYRDKLIYAVGAKPQDGVEGIKIDNMLIENAGGECIRLKYFAKYNEISNAKIKNCGAYDFIFNEGGKNGEGIYIGTAPEQLDDGRNPTDDPDESSSNWIHNNYIETNGNECVDVKEASHDNLIEHNQCTGQLDPDSGGMDSRGDNNVFRYNKIYGNVGAGVRLGGDDEEDGIDNDVYENVIEDNQGYGIKILRWPQGKICGNDFTGNQDEDIGGEFGSNLSAHLCN